MDTNSRLSDGEMAIRDLAAGLGTQMSRLVKQMRREARNDEHLSLTERSTLSLIYNLAPILPGELAAMEKVTTQAMSQVINQLLAQELIDKTTSTQDRRKSTRRGKDGP